MKAIDGLLLKMELRRGVRGVLVWTLAISVAIVLVIALYPMVIDMYAAIPPEFADLMRAFGGIPDTIVDYYASEGGMMLQLFGAIFAALQGFGAINRDERERTAESLYVLPRTRGTFFRTKLLRVTIEVLAFAVVCALASVLGFAIVGEPVDYGPFFTFSGLNAVVLLMFTWLSFAMACLMKTNAKPMSAIAVPFTLYVISIIALATDDAILDTLKYLTPYTFADPIEILKSDYAFEWISFTVYLGLTTAGTVLAWRAFAKREFLG